MCLLSPGVVPAIEGARGLACRGLVLLQAYSLDCRIIMIPNANLVEAGASFGASSRCCLQLGTRACASTSSHDALDKASDPALLCWPHQALIHPLIHPLREGRRESISYISIDYAMGSTITDNALRLSTYISTIAIHLVLLCANHTLASSHP